MEKYFSRDKQKKELASHAIRSSACRETGFFLIGHVFFPFLYRRDFPPCTQNAIHLEALLPTKWVNCGVVKTKRSGIDLKKLVEGERKKAIDGNSPELLDVGGDARQSINAVDDAVLLDELGAAFQHHRDWGRATHAQNGLR